MVKDTTSQKRTPERTQNVFAHKRMSKRLNESSTLRSGTERVMTAQKASKAVVAKPKNVRMSAKS